MSDEHAPKQLFAMTVWWKNASCGSYQNIESFEPTENAYLAGTVGGRRIVIPYHAVTSIEVTPV